MLNSVTAKARLPDKKSAKALSPYTFLASLNLSIITDERVVAPIAVKRGFIFNNNPKAIPARETCDSVSAISEYRLKTKKIPMTGAIIAMMRPATRPLIMKSY